MKTKLKWLGLPILIILVALLFGFSPYQVRVTGSGFLSISSNIEVSAQGSLTEKDIKELALDEYKGSTLTEKTLNQYEIDYSGTGSKISIGEADKEVNFKPDVTISHWNGEASFKLIAPVDIEEKSQLATSLDSLQKSVTATSGQWTFEYKVTEPKTDFNEYGGLDIFITAKEKPKSNKIYFTYDSDTVTPYLQPSLTTEYKGGWSDEFNGEIKVTDSQVILLTDEKGIPLKEPQVVCERPEHVVNSIAFYANEKANHAIGGVNYGTGKIGHLYRMKVNDQWCDWSVEGQYIVLTIPFEVFDKATYPVTIAPVGDTFGYTGAGGSTIVPGANKIYGQQGTVGATGGTVDNIITSVQYHSGSKLKAVLVLTSNLNIVANGVGGEITGATNSKGWLTLTYTTAPTVVATTNYKICWIAYDGDFEFFYDSGGVDPQRFFDTTNSYSTPTNPTDGTTTGTYYSIYCTYTPSASFDISNTPSSKAFGVVAASTTYYAKGSAPSNPVVDGDCTFAVTNNAASACDLDIHGHNATGGVGWTLTANAPGSNEYRLTCYYTGQNPASGTVLTTSDQEFYDALAASAHIHWDFKLETGTFTDGSQKTGIITLTAVAED